MTTTQSQNFRSAARSRGRAAALATALVVGALAAAASPAAAAPTDRTVVDAWYRDFLGRDAGADPGSQYWVDRVATSGASDALGALTRTREYNQRQVTAYYNTHLQRSEDAGARYWVDGATAGRFPLEWAEQNILASKEYADLWARVHRSPDRTHLAAAWVLAVLERRTTPAEASYWAGRIDTVGRLGALRELWYTDEAVRHRIGSHYRDLLLRDADGGGLTWWYGYEVRSDLEVQVALATSPEYRSTRETS